MSVWEYYNEKQSDIAWKKLFSSSGNRSFGNIFEQTSTNFRSLSAYINDKVVNKLNALDNTRSTDNIAVAPAGQSIYKHLTPRCLRMGFLVEDGGIYHVTPKGKMLVDDLSGNTNLNKEEKWVLIFLLTLNRTKSDGDSKNFYLFRTVLELYSVLHNQEYELTNFLRGLIDIARRESLTKDVFCSDVFWLVTFFRDANFINEYFSSSEEERNMLYNHVKNEYVNNKENTEDFAVRKMAGDTCPYPTFSDETRQVLCTMILLMLQDSNISNFLELYSELFLNNQNERLKEFYEAHRELYNSEYNDAMGKINEMTEVSLMDKDIEIRLNDVKAALGLTADDEGAKNYSLNTLPAKGPRHNNLEPSNLILYGPPGTGKTYRTVEYALSIIENNKFPQDGINVAGSRKDQLKRFNGYIDKGRVVFTTFHQSFDYEDFIQGLRPISDGENISFKLVDGVFKKIADKAMYDTGHFENGVRVENNYVIIIDEINRGNISKIFGELITLIDEDKRWGEPEQLKLRLPSGDVFAVPNNLYIIGTMNSSDKSISLLDAALRRRFYFVEVAPDYNLVKNGTYKKVLMRLNDKLKEKFRGSTDSLIGHSYFMNENITLDKIFNNSVIPLLYEYCYDNTKKVKEIVDYALDTPDKTSFKAIDADERRIIVTYVGES